MKARADPVIAVILTAQVDLGGRVDQRGSAPVSTEASGPIAIDVAASLSAARKEAERRRIHGAYRPVKPISKRPSMLDRHRAEIDVLTCLKALHPNRFTDHHLRTTQRMVH